MKVKEETEEVRQSKELVPKNMKKKIYWQLAAKSMMVGSINIEQIKLVMKTNQK